ncbi:MAG: PAS domain-containing protein [Dehalococcoidia bacterium]|nr:PAS domain-containing protein [Dehalococcoidia bacterium]
MPDTGYLYLLSLIDEGIFVLGERREIRYMNQAAARIFGIEDDKSGNTSFIEAVRDYECDALVKKCISTGVPQTAAVKIRGKNQYLDLKVCPGAETGSYIVIVKDLSEKRHLEEIRRDFISNVSHEFRTPISSIKLIAETLDDGAPIDGEVYKDFLQKINVEADKLARMTDELTELSRLENSEQALIKDTLKIDILVQQVVQRLQAQSDRKELTLNLDVEPELPDLIIDQYRIEQVLLNIIHNAIKFTASGGSISIAVKKQGNEILFAVSDTGIGIPADELPRIFERFYKVNKARDDEGTGLGLAISRHIVTAHGGKIWVESVEGKGSAFFFTLPMDF